VKNASFVTEKHKNTIALAVILFVNCVFAIKYAERYTDWYMLVAAFSVIVQLLLFAKRNVIFEKLQKIKHSSFFILVICSAIFLFLASQVPLESLRVNRWSVITSFWDCYFNNLYVYKAKAFDGIYPGAMPFYFVLMFPFYLLREFSYVTVIAVFGLYFLLKTEKQKGVYMLLIVSSITFLYEVLTRSTIFFNSVLIVASLYYFFNTKTNIFFKGIVIGLLLSTRNVYVFVYGIAFIYALRNSVYSFRNLLTMGVVALLTFAATFIPFVINHSTEFSEANPFLMETSAFMPPLLTFLCVIISLLFAFFAKNKSDIFFLSGVTLFLTIVSYFAYHIIINGFHTAFWGSVADVTYFIFCVPFFLYFLIENGSKLPKQSVTH